MTTSHADLPANETSLCAVELTKRVVSYDCHAMVTLRCISMTFNLRHYLEGCKIDIRPAVFEVGVAKQNPSFYTVIEWFSSGI
jgi:hypothetical protein